MVLEIIAIVISVVSLVISVFFTVWNTRPHIRIKIDDCVHALPSKIVCVMITFNNKSPIAGDIETATLFCNNQKFECIKNRELFDFSKIGLRSAKGFAIDFAKTAKSLPITVRPFSHDFAMLCFPVEEITVPIEKASLKIDFVSGKRRFFHITPDILDTPIDENEEYQQRKATKKTKNKRN